MESSTHQQQQQEPQYVNSVEKILGPSRISHIIHTDTIDFVLDSEMIGWIILNNKKKSANVIGIEFVEDMKRVLSSVDQFIDAKRVKVIVFYSDKNTFLAGADIVGMYPLTDEKIATEVSRNGQRLFDRINALKIPTLAAINGSALGGGLELCLACTYRAAAKDKRIQIGLPEVKIGVIPGAGGTVRLPKIIGLQEALKIIMAGGSVNPIKGKSIGLVDYLVEYEDRIVNENRFFEEIRNLAGLMVDKSPKREVAPKHKTYTDKLLNDTWIGRNIVANQALKGLDKMTRGKYPAPYKALESVINSYKVSTPSALDFEAQAFGRMCVSAECKNLMSVFFLNEQAKKLDRVKGKGKDAKKVTVIGAGVMGSGIAQLFAQKNIQVYMKDIKDEFVQKGLAFCKGIFDELVKKNRLTKEEANRRMNLIKGGTDNSGVKDSQVVIEAAIEKMDLKKKILQDVESSYADPNTIFATNTSTLSINELATVSKRPENVVGMHFFNPVAKMPLVEIIKGKHTSDDTVATIYKLSLKLGKVPIIVGDGPGFLVNRILGIYLLEAGRMLKEGGDISQIDNTLLDFGMPMGPFRLFDEVGIDVAEHSSSTLEVLGERFKRDPELNIGKLVQNGFLGKKTGKGFYHYENGKSKGIEPSLTNLMGYQPKQTKKIPTEDIVDRCVLLMVNEAAYILSEGIAEKPEDVDIGMIFGTGFAPFRGGLLSYADNRGVKNVVKRLNELQERTKDARFKPAPLLIKMAQNNERFYPQKPLVQLNERTKMPKPRL